MAAEEKCAWKQVSSVFGCLRAYMCRLLISKGNFRTLDEEKRDT